MLAKLGEMLTRMRKTVLFIICLQLISFSSSASLEPVECGQAVRTRIMTLHYPWQVRLLNSATDSHHCGGTILSRGSILTAASCLPSSPATSLTVQVGGRGPGLAVCETSVHPEFNSSNFHNDLAVLHLCQPLNLTRRVAPICLPDPSLDSENLNSVLTGWWSSSPGGGQVAQVLQEVFLTTITNHRCSEYYPEPEYQLTDSMVCAEEAENSICQGSGGSPLVHRDQDGRYTQVGLMSWGVGCGDPRYPSVYTRLTSALAFINSQL